MRLSKQQRALLEFLMESPSGAWSRGTVRRELYGHSGGLDAAQRAAFSRMLRALEWRMLIVLGDGQHDGQYIRITTAGRTHIVNDCADGGGL